MTSAADPPKFKFVQKDDGISVSWSSRPTNILIVHKFCDDAVLDDLKQLTMFILQTWNVTVYLEASTFGELRKDGAFTPVLEAYMHETTDHSAPQACLCTAQSNTVGTAKFNSNSCLNVFNKCSVHCIDLVICLGGDGTLLKISSLFQKSVPPVLAFRLGTLGFLTPLPFKTYPTSLHCAIEGSPHCLMRSRMQCLVVRGPGSSNADPVADSSRNNSPDTEYHFLNELVVDRGLSASLCDLLIKVNGRVVTHCEGDGLIVSTPTGSTAYSMAAGASMVHPAVPAFLLTPINSLTLSSRAIVLPIHLRLEITITPTARCKVVHFSFDGRSRASNLLREGDSIIVSGSPYPMPCLTGEDQGVDWFGGLQHLLNWNARSRVRTFSGSADSDDGNTPHCL